MTTNSQEHAEPAQLGLFNFSVTALQLGLLMFSIRALELEYSLGLVAIAPLIFVGYCCHAWLPGAWKLPFFLLLSEFAFCLVLGPWAALILTLIGLGLVGICHLRIAFGLRILLMLGAALSLAALRLDWVSTPWARSVLPVLGAMFMFRAIIYLYDLRNERVPASIWMRLSYFFLLPNVCFVLFPVIDYRTFQRTYYEKPAHEIHQRGVQWILRGLMHLLLYRVVYFYLTPSVGEIKDVVGVVLFVVSSYLLYLRISGHFHLIIGILHLFGFHLPETNHRYLLALSFTDCWRRINIYWTEFMKKIFYFPAFVRLRRRSLAFAVVGSTVVTFLATWLLHAYQWFWLHGSFPLSTDGLFWGVAGLLAVGSMALELKYGSRRILGSRARSWPLAARYSAQAMGVFALISLIWSMWCSTSLSQWIGIMGQARHASGSQLLGVIGLCVCVFALGTLAQYVSQSASSSVNRLGFWQRVLLSTVGTCLIACVGVQQVQRSFGPEVANLMIPLTGEYLNSRDQERLTSSYYDRLVRREGFGGRVSERERVDPNAPEFFLDSPLSSIVEGPLRWEMPALTKEVFLGALVETNEFGMRDKHYSREKPQGTLRVAIIGTCYEMGAGVVNDEVWEVYAEDQLNLEVSPRTGLRYEILNFAVPAYNMLDQVVVARQKLAAFSPDVVLLSNHAASSVEYMLELGAGTAEMPAGLGRLLAELESLPELDWATLTEEWALGEIAKACRRFGARPVYMNIPLLTYTQGRFFQFTGDRIAEQQRLAESLGYESIDLSTAFDGHAFDSLAILPSQCCPNATGHRLLGKSLFEALAARPDLLRVP